MNGKPTKRGPYRALIMLAYCCLPLAVQAQAETFATLTRSPIERVIKQPSLKQVLQRLQDHYGISFVYESDVVTNVVVLQPLVLNSVRNSEAKVQEYQ